MKRQKVINFGCRLNSYESSVIEEKLKNSDLENVIVFNSCAVTKEAERQVKQSIRKTRRENPDAKIIVTGCSAQLNPNQYTDMSEVDRVIGNEEKLDDKYYVKDNLFLNDEKAIVNDIMSVKDTALHMLSSFGNKTRAFIQVQNGCNHRCTFCIIPYARGNSRSVPFSQIVKQIEYLVANDFKEVVLTGVDLSDYGLDLPGNLSLGKMIKRLLSIVKDLPRLRISSIDVAEIDDDLMELILYEPRLMPHIHISLQSGDNMILKRMRRRHNRQDVINFCTKAYEKRPEISFGADIITGFPTETDEMFLNTLDLVETVGFQFLHVFPYSEREGTPAARIPPVPVEIRNNRAQLLREAGKKQLDLLLKRQIGKELSALVEKNEIAISENFCNIRLNDKHVSPNTLVKVKINAVEGSVLLGNIV